MAVEKAYEVTVGTSESDSKERAIALATRVLTYSDHSDSFALGSLIDVNAYGVDDPEQQIGVSFQVVVSEPDSERFEHQLEMLKNVETFEEISYIPA